MQRDKELPRIAGDEALESILTQAGPRPMPPPHDIARARDAVRGEWQAVVGRRRRRRLLIGVAAAASAVFAVFVGFDFLQTEQTPAIQVANIDRSIGSIYLLGDRSELREQNDLMSVLSGQTVVTGALSGVAFSMQDGAALRVDERSRVEFVDANTVFLHDGRVYVDAGLTRASELRVQSEHGVVTHQGTQYMMTVDGRTLSVSVREGKVSIDGSYHDSTVMPGQLVSFSGSGRPDVVNIALSGEHWQWVEAIAPSANFDGRSLHEFLEWVSRETGLQLQFETLAAEQLAVYAILSGEIETTPTDALRVWMLGIDLDWRIEGGVIFISENDQ